MVSILHEKEFCIASETQRLLVRAATAAESGGLVSQDMFSSRRFSTVGRQSSNRQSLARGLAVRGRTSIARCWQNRPQVEVVGRRSVPVGSNPLGRRYGRGVRNRPLDAQADRASDSSDVWRRVSFGSCVESAETIGLELPAHDAKSPRTKRRQYSTLVAVSLAIHQKKARQTKSLLIFLDESGFSQQPSVRRTWSPRGQTPILVAPFNWKRLSAIASLITTPHARRVGLCLRLVPGTVKQPQVLAYLQALRKHVRGRRVVLLWDRLPAHRGAKVQKWIDRQSNWLTIEYLPPYAPELNPVEYFWSHLSRTDMAQYVGEDLEAVRRQARKAASRVRRRQNLGKAFLVHSGLFT